MTIKKHIPNAITCMNLLSGCIATTMAFKGLFFYALLFILLAAVFDFFDGMVARLLGVSSPIGKELDSLADLISFGLTPSVMVYTQLSWSMMPGVDVDTAIVLAKYLCYGGFVIAMASGLRLAKFNVDNRQTSSFIGLATPANALFFAGLLSVVDPLTPVAGYIDRTLFMGVLFHPVALLMLALFFSFLMVSEIPMFSLKFKNLKWADNKVRFIFLCCALLLLASLHFVAFPFVILLYIVLSVVNTYAMDYGKRKA